MYTIDQSLFKNESSCTQACSLVALCNDYDKRMTQHSIIDYEDFLYRRQERPAPRKSLQIRGGAIMTSTRFEEYYGVDIEYRELEFGSKIMRNRLKKGDCVVVTINITQEFMKQFNAGYVTGREGKGTKIAGIKSTGGHGLCLRMINGELYGLNTWKDGSKNVFKIKSLDIPGLFRRGDKNEAFYFIQK